MIAKRQQPLVRLAVIKPAKSKRQIGWAKGLVTRMNADFDAPLDDLEEYMFTSTELKRRRVVKKSK